MIFIRLEVSAIWIIQEKLKTTNAVLFGLQIVDVVKQFFKKIGLQKTRRVEQFAKSGFSNVKFQMKLFQLHTYNFSAVSVSPVAANVLSTSTCLSSPFPIRPIVAHPSQPPTGSLSLLPPFYMPAAMYSHQGKVHSSLKAVLFK